MMLIPYFDVEPAVDDVAQTWWLFVIVVFVIVVAQFVFLVIVVVQFVFFLIVVVVVQHMFSIDVVDPFRMLHSLNSRPLLERCL